MKKKEDINPVDMDCMKAFIAICASGRLSKAAEQLFVSKQALSVLVKKMENELGTSLLEREKTGVKLTPAGECFYEYAKRILELWEQCRQSVESIRNASPKQLRVGLAYMSQNLWTTQCESAFAGNYPEIELLVESDISKNLLKGLDEERYDVVVTCMQQQYYGRYTRVPVLEKRVGVLMSEDDPLEQKSTLTADDLQGRLLLYPNSGAEFLHRFEQQLLRMGVNVETMLLPGGNFLRNLKNVRDLGGLLLSDGMFRYVVPEFDGYCYKEFEKVEQLPMIGVSALMRKGEEREDALTFIDFFKKNAQKKEV